MSAVDYPPGIGLPADEPRTLRAPTRRKMAARLGLVVAVFVGVWVLRTVARQPQLLPMASGLVVAAVAMNVLALMVRLARVKFYGDALGWGWDALEFRVALPSIRAVLRYDRALTLRTKWGGVWYLGVRDWGDVTPLCEALSAANVEVQKKTSRPSLREHMAGYGVPLDIAQVVSIVAIALYGLAHAR